ncbi:MAG: ZIP family metal transporter [Candidatus Paceibacterota bacterium]
MNTIAEILLVGFGIMLVSLSGVLFLGGLTQRWLSKNLPLLLSFSAGVFFLTAFDLVRESFELLSATFAGLSVLGGYLLFLLLQRAIPESHHHHGADDCDDSHNERSALRILLGDAIHNAGDGILLVPAFLASPALGFATSISIFAHEFLQEISEFFILKGAGYSTGKALARNFFASSTILVGIFLGFILQSLGEVQGVLLGVAAGGFLYIVFHDLILHRSTSLKGKRFVFHVVAFLFGAVAILYIGSLFVHGHGVESDQHDQEILHLE